MLVALTLHFLINKDENGHRMHFSPEDEPIRLRTNLAEPSQVSVIRRFKRFTRQNALRTQTTVTVKSRTNSSIVSLVPLSFVHVRLFARLASYFRLLSRSLVAVPDGSFKVTLMFAEIYNQINSAGDRYFRCLYRRPARGSYVTNYFVSHKSVDSLSYTKFPFYDRLMILTYLTRQAGSIQLTMLSVLSQCVMVRCRFACSRLRRTVS